MTIESNEWGLKKFPVEVQALKDAGYDEISAKQLKDIRRDKDHPLHEAARTELYLRQSVREKEVPVNGDEIDKTYIYPGEEPPPGKKWALIDDDTPGGIAYVVED